MSQAASDQYIGKFEVDSRDAILRHLGALGENWKWTVLPEESKNYTLQLNRQPLLSGFIVQAAHSSGLEAIAARDISRICIIFMLAGEVEVYDRRSRQTLHISANQVASLRSLPGTQLYIKPRSSWLALQVPEARLQQHFEDLTGKPYVEKFMLAPTDFRLHDTQGLYQTLRQAERDLTVARPMERTMLARAYKALALTKLFAHLPHNLTNAFKQGTLDVAPRQLLRAEAFMRASLYSPATLEDLANAAGCSSRALQRMFHKYRGDTPMGILCRYRLAAAQGAIKAGLVESITDLAISLQFSNPGRFSVLYKNEYGISPSLDLRNTRKRNDEV